MADIDREVAEAMSGMDASDLAELRGDSRPASMSSGGVPKDGASPGTELTGTVCAVTNDDVFLEFDAKNQGILSRSQFGKKEVIELGRKVDVVVDHFDQSAGLLMVNRKGQAQRATWTTLKPDMVVEGKVSGMNKGGLEVEVNGLRAFMPASQVDLIPPKDISVLLNQHIRAIVLEVDRRGKNILISRRKLMEKERAENRDTLLTDLQAGQVRRGKVSNITEFGAFVDLGGVDGLVHIRDITWGNVEKVSDHLTIGQEVEVKVLRINKERDRISLGMKQIQPDPWVGAEDRFPVGTSTKARVVRLADFGAFVEVEPGVEGLIPLSEMSWGRVKGPSEAAAVGDILDAVVIRIEPDKKRMALSLKQASADPWSTVLDGYTPGVRVKGKVTRLTEFGAFVELVPGVEGLIHISEMSDKRIRTCSEVVNAGDEIEARVLGVDREKRRISLSLKPETSVTAADMAAAAAQAEAAKPKKQRKKALRGGLTGGWDFAGDLKFDVGGGE
jgi:small subunit ribosomal protein S1